MNARFLDTGYGSAYFNMGLDESVLKHVSEGKSPATLRFYAWKPPAVSIGYFQSLAEEVDEGACRSRGVDVVRRMTGGGAVYHDRELTYSYIAPEDTAPDDILESYRLICGGLVEGFKLLGVDAGFAPLNDIVTGGKKISGNAQTRKMKCVLQHGTVLLGVDAKEMFTLLKVPSEKIRDKMIAAVEERVTSVEDVLNQETSYSKAAAAFRKGFERALGLELDDSEPMDSEVGLAEELASNKYSTAEWNNRR